MSTTDATTDIIPKSIITTYPKKNELPDSYTTVFVWMIAFIMFFSLAGNTLALSSLCRNWKSVYPWFFNMAVADLLKTLFCMPYSIYLTQSEHFSDSIHMSLRDTKCQIIGYIFHLTLLMGLISNMCVALDRVHATYFPFHYSNNLKRFPAQYLIALTWIFVLLIAALPFLQYATHQNKAPFGMTAMYMPMCVFDIKDVEWIREIEDPGVADVYVTLYYSILYLLPVIVIVTCTCLVMKKLLPRIMAEKKLHECTKSSVVIANSMAMGEDPGLVTVGEENQSCTLSANGANCSSPKSKKKGKLSILDNMLKLHAGNKPVNRTHSKRNQWRAIQTMVIVSISFVMCHVIHILFWVLYNDVFRPLDVQSDIRQLPKSQFIALSSLKTGQIIIVYLDAAVNVIVYYSRCKLIRDSMLDTARTFATFVMSPVFMIMRNVRD